MIIWMEVEDIDRAVSDIERAGGRLAGDINEIPGEGRLCYVEDPQGTVFGLKASVGESSAD